MHEWISPINVAPRELDAPDLHAGRALGAAVLQVLGFRDGFSHMEWYRKADGEVVFGERRHPRLPRHLCRLPFISPAGTTCPVAELAVPASTAGRIPDIRRRPACRRAVWPERLADQVFQRTRA
jgi:hypothetical protein